MEGLCPALLPNLVSHFLLRFFVQAVCFSEIELGEFCLELHIRKTEIAEILKDEFGRFVKYYSCNHPYNVEISRIHYFSGFVSENQLTYLLVLLLTKKEKISIYDSFEK